MSIPPISSMPTYAPLFLESATPSQPVEESVNPANIPLESDIINIHGTKYKLFKDINPDTHELEEGVFVKSPYPNIPALKLEGTEDLIYETRKGNDRREIFDNHAHHLKNKYVGFFPKESSTEDSYRCKRLHTCIGKFDIEGKLLKGVWKTYVPNFDFELIGDFTYETTETEQIIRCKGSFTTGYSRVTGSDTFVVHGTFEAKRQLKESFFYCSRIDEVVLPEELESRTDSDGTIRKGIFLGDKLLKGKKETSTDIFEGEFDSEELLICGSKTIKSLDITLKGLWYYFDNPRSNELMSNCYGELINHGQAAMVTYDQTGSFKETVLQVGKSLFDPEMLVEGRFFDVDPRYPRATQVTVFYNGEEPKVRWIVGFNFYKSHEQASRAARSKKPY